MGTKSLLARGSTLISSQSIWVRPPVVRYQTTLAVHSVKGVYADHTVCSQTVCHDSGLSGYCYTNRVVAYWFREYCLGLCGGEVSPFLCNSFCMLMPRVPFDKLGMEKIVCCIAPRLEITVIN